MPELFTIEGGKLELNPHRFQCQVLDSKAQHTFVLKGWRGGYTSIAPWWLIQTMQACGPSGRAMHYLCITPTIRGARGGLMSTMQSVFCDTLNLGTFLNSPNPRIVISKEGEQYLWGHTQREPSEIHFVFAEEPDSFAHYTAMAAVADEVGQKKFRFASWGVLKARLSTQSGQISTVDGLPKGRLLAGSTVYELNWLQDLWDEWLQTVMERWHAMKQEATRETDPIRRKEIKADFHRLLYEGGLHPQMNFMRFDSTKNPSFNPQEFINARRSLPNWFFQMRYRARFVRPAGMIFEAFNPANHVLSELPL
jgi:hypothetical protein